MFLFEDESEEMEQNLFKFRTRIGNTVTRFAIFLIAFVMIAYGLNAVYSIIQLQDDESWVRWANILIEVMDWSDSEPLHMSRFLRLPGAIFFVVGGSMILLDVRRTFVRSVGLYALAMGVNRIDGKNIVRIYGHDGMFVDIYTENPLIYEDNKISHTLDKLVRKY